MRRMRPRDIGLSKVPGTRAGVTYVLLSMQFGRHRLRGPCVVHGPAIPQEE
jgi:hypothetical protein